MGRFKMRALSPPSPEDVLSEPVRVRWWREVSERIESSTFWMAEVLGGFAVLVIGGTVAAVAWVLLLFAVVLIASLFVTPVFQRNEARAEVASRESMAYAHLGSAQLSAETRIAELEHELADREAAAPCLGFGTPRFFEAELRPKTLRNTGRQRGRMLGVPLTNEPDAINGLPAEDVAVTGEVVYEEEGQPIRWNVRWDRELPHRPDSKIDRAQGESLELTLSSPGREYYFVPFVGYRADADLFAWTTGGLGPEVSQPHTVKFRLTLTARGSNAAAERSYDCCYEPPFLYMDGEKVADVGE